MKPRIGGAFSFSVFQKCPVVKPSCAGVLIVALQQEKALEIDQERCGLSGGHGGNGQFRQDHRSPVGLAALAPGQADAGLRADALTRPPRQCDVSRPRNADTRLRHS